MINFLVMTMSFTLAMVLASVIVTVAMFALMCNGKFIAWTTKVYMKAMEKSMSKLEKVFEDLGA